MDSRYPRICDIRANAVVCRVLGIALSAFASVAIADNLPTGPTGLQNVAIPTTSTDGLTMTINQLQERGVINWGSFNIGSGYTVNFSQPSTAAVVLNRIAASGGISKIDGNLNANGNVFLMNPAGIVFGSGAQVNVNGLLATTFDIPADQFLNGQIAASTSNASSIVNNGTITLGSNGFLYLVAPTVDNEGTVKANIGTVTLGNAGTYDVSLGNNNSISFEVPQTVLPSSVSVTNGSSAAVDNAQTILLSSSQAAGVTSSVVNSGDLQAADSLTLQGGTVTSANTLSAPNVTVSASIVANGATSSTPIQTDATNTLTFEVGDSTTAGGTLQQMNGDTPVLNAVTSGAPLTVQFTHQDANQNTVLDSELTYALPASNTLLGTLATTANESFTSGINFTQKTSGVELTNVKTSGDLSITANGEISDLADNSADITTDTADIWANNLTLTTTAPGTSIGVQGYGYDTPQLSDDIPPNYLNVDVQGTLNASADNSDIFIQSTDGDLTVGHIDTGMIPQIPSANNANRVLLQTFLRAENGNIVQGTGSDDYIHAGGGVNTTGADGGAVTLFAGGAIGSDGNPIQLQAGELQADTNDGGIFINNNSMQGLAITHAVARQKITIDTGNNTSVTAFKSGQINGSGQYLLPDGSTGTHDVSITSEGGILLAGGNITATRDTSLTSTQGSIAVLSSQSQAPYIGGRYVNLDAAKDIGVLELNPIVGVDVSGMPLTVVTERVDANAGGDIYLASSADLVVGWLNASGDAALHSSQGSIALGTQEDVSNLDYKSGIGVTVNGTLLATADNGSIVNGCGGTSSSACGSQSVVQASTAKFVAKTGIGSSGNPLKTDVGTLITSITADPSTTTNYATYVNNDVSDGGLNTIDVTTPGDSVQIADQSGSNKIFDFSAATSDLSVTPANNNNADFNLSFADTSGGDLAIGDIVLPGNSVTLSLSGSGILTSIANTQISAATADLSAGQIGSSSTSPLATNVTTLSATAANGISIANTGAAALNLQNAQATGSGANVDITTDGSLVLLDPQGALPAQSIVAANDLSLTASGGSISMPDGSANRLTAAGLSLSAMTDIGEPSQPVRTSVTGPLAATASNGSIYLDNTGSVSMFAANADNGAGDITFNNTGDVSLYSLTDATSFPGVTGSNVVLDLTGGSLTEGTSSSSGPTIQADTLGITAAIIGTDQNPLLVNTATIDNLTANGGGINVSDTSTAPSVLLESATTLGGALNFSANPTIDLGVLTATGEPVVLTSLDGSILDGRSMSQLTDPNITAFSADLSAGSNASTPQDIGSAAAPLALKVNMFSGSANGGNIYTQNDGPLAVTASTLTGKGPDQNISISGSSITILPLASSLSNPISLDAGDNLDLTATDGNIVFLNSQDTIKASANDVSGTYQGGDITLTAKAGESVASAYNGNIILGNLITSNGGNITINAARNVTLGLLSTNGSATGAPPVGPGGNITVQAQDGVILDGNGANQNLIGNHVILTANAPSANDAEYARINAIATAKSLASAADVLQTNLTTASTLVSADTTLLNLDTTELNLATADQNSKQSAYNTLVTDDTIKNAILWYLQDGCDIAQLALDILDIPESVPEGIPLTGDGGAATIRATESVIVGALSIALNVASQAASVVDAQLSSAASELDVATARVQSDQRNLIQDNANLNAATANETLVNNVYDTTLHLSQAAALLQLQSIDASGIGQDLNVAANGIKSSAAIPLGIQANRLDIGATLVNGQVSGTLNGGVYLSSPTSLGLGAINVAGNIEAEAQGNLSLGVDNSQIQSGGDIVATADTGNIVVSGPITAGGNLTATADQGAITFGAPITASGNIVAEAQGNIGLGVGDYQVEAVNGDITTTSQQGNITIEGPTVAGGNITAMADQGDITFGAPVTASGNIDATASNGTIGGSGTLTASSLAAIAGNGVGSSTQPLQTSVGSIAIDAGNGFVNVVNNEGSQPQTLNVTTVDGISGIKGEGGISLSQTGNLALYQPIADSNLSTTDAVDLTVHGGGIQDDNGSAVNVQSASLNVSSDQGVSLDTLIDTGTINVNTGGDIAVRQLQSKDVHFASLTTPDGSISASGGGNIALGTVSAGAVTGSGDITVDAGGAITSDGSASAMISGTTLMLTAQGGGIGAVPATFAGGLNTAVDSLQATAAGDITIHEQNALALTSVSTSLGNVTIKNDSGALTLGQVTDSASGSNITLDAVAGQINTTANSGINLSADQIALQGGAGVGSASAPLTFNASDIGVDGGTGGVFLVASSGDVQIGGVTPNFDLFTLNGIDAASDVSVLTQAGSLTVADAVNTGGNLTATAGQGDLTIGAPVTVTGNIVGTAQGNITVNGPTVAGGNVTLTAQAGSLMVSDAVKSGGNLTATADQGNITFGAPVTATGNILGTAQGNITVDGPTVAGGNVTLTAQTGALDMTTSGSVNAGGNLNAAAAGDVTVSTVSAANDVTIDSDNGAVIALPLTGTAVNVSAKYLALTAQNDIGSASVPLTTQVDSVSATINGAGSLYLAEADNLNLGPVSINQGDAVVSAGGDIQVGDVTAKAGNVQLTSLNGAVTSESGKLVTTNALDVTAAGPINLVSDISTASLDSSNGSVTLSDVGSIDRVDATASSTVSVTAVGDIGVGLVTSGGQTSIASGGAITAVDSASKINAPDILLQAQNDIGSASQALNVDPPQITATSAAGSIYLNDAVGPVDWVSVQALNGDIDLSNANGDATIGVINSGGNAQITSTGSLTADGVNSVVSAQQLTLVAGAGGIGPLEVNAPVLNASVGTSGSNVTGDIVLNDGVAVTSFTASTQNGDISLVVPTGDLGVDTVTAPGHTVQLTANGGQIVDANSGGLNVASSYLAMQAADGIGSPSDPLHTSVSTLAADGGNGGVFVNNDSASLTIGDVNGLSGLTAALGDLFLANTGNMLVSSNVSGTGHITLTSDGDLTQSGAIQTQGSTILAYAAGMLTTEAGASTTLGSGEIGYDSDTELVLDGSMSASTSNYGVIVLKAPQLDLVSQNPILSAQALLVDITNLDQPTKNKLLAITSGTETLQLINATLVKSPNFWAMSCSGESAGTSTSAGTGNWTSCQQ